MLLITFFNVTVEKLIVSGMHQWEEFEVTLQYVSKR